MIAPEQSPITAPIPMMMIRMRCPACLFDYRFLVSVDVQMPDLPEITKQTMRCRCDNHIPKIGKNTPLDKSLMSINGIPLRVLKERTLITEQGYGKD